MGRRLTDKARAEIKASPDKTYDLARRYGVSATAIWAIRGYGPNSPKTLTDKEAMGILRSLGTYEEIANRYGVTKQTVHNIKKGKSHGELTAEVRMAFETLTEYYELKPFFKGIRSKRHMAKLQKEIYPIGLTFSTLQVACEGAIRISLLDGVEKVIVEQITDRAVFKAGQLCSSTTK